MKNNILLIAHNDCVLNEIASLLGKEVQMRTLDFNKYVEYNLGRDEKFVIDNLGLDYYWGKYNKAYKDLEDFEDALIITTPRMCLNEEVLSKAIRELYVVCVDIPIKEQEKEISQYLLKKNYIYNNKKTKLLKNFRYLKSHADIVIKYKGDSKIATKEIISLMLEESGE